MRLFVATCSLLILGFFWVYSVNAQVAAEDTTNIQLSNLERSYLNQINNYKLQTENYQLAKSQYEKIQTLAALEELLKASRELQLIRADLYSIFIQLLDEHLNQARGVAIERKNALRVSLSLKNDQIVLHKNAVASAQDRESLDELAKDFPVIASELENQTYYTLSLVKIGRFQQALDKLILVREKLTEELANRNLSSTTLTEKNRAIREIDKTQNKMFEDFNQIKTSVESQTSANTGSYAGLSNRLSGVYADLNQLVSQIEEVRK